jgi:hypothetical protein
MTLKIQALEDELKNLEFVPVKTPGHVSSEELLPQFELTNNKKVASLLLKLKALVESFISKTGILVQLTHDPTKKEELRKAYE